MGTGVGGVLLRLLPPLPNPSPARGEGLCVPLLRDCSPLPGRGVAFGIRAWF